MRDIKCFGIKKGYYKITEDGKVWSNIYNKFLSCKYDKDGYLDLLLVCEDGKRRHFRIHRLVAETFLVNKFNLPVINHKNGIKSDNNLHNLEWSTIRDNNIHAINLGLKKPLKGINHNMVKLKINEVLDIRENKNNLTHKKLSEIYNISASQIGRIIRKERWINP